MGNGCVAGDLAPGQGARREQVLPGSVTDEQRGPNAKELQPSGRSSGELLAALLFSDRTRGSAPSSRLAGTRQSFAHPFPIYEMCSRRLLKYWSGPRCQYRRNPAGARQRGGWSHRLLVPPHCGGASRPLLAIHPFCLYARATLVLIAIWGRLYSHWPDLRSTLN